MHSPPTEPLGLEIIGAADKISSALDGALTATGGSLVIWLVLVAASGKDHHHQSHEAMYTRTNAEEPGRVNQLLRMETAGLVTYNSDPSPRGTQSVALTDTGRELFHRLLRAVVAFDKQLRNGLPDDKVAAFGDTLTILRNNITGTSA